MDMQPELHRLRNVVAIAAIPVLAYIAWGIGKTVALVMAGAV